ncbi:hypothetical protein PTSG_12825 [Salpingoeca rosetta]|uniref:Uncharacterized protein n=1 Tax=Salpingoeca rosetta (strain ATCC 50818 / BSB-021) TaxID=946362 RepID=F2ULZ3_SALR5|nr:uncharacterized protein PTSG_12825 [Salpingoeca rosetta]EGD78142.1 hypothetical protein PTSG_12825 [Salpingoeca rosetta]|eukprot:XP_004989818.1 hypothetical protein PTSG_12825 [Salpingoeca rosetta]
MSEQQQQNQEQIPEWCEGLIEAIMDGSCEGTLTLAGEYLDPISVSAQMLARILEAIASSNASIVKLV